MAYWLVDDFARIFICDQVFVIKTVVIKTVFTRELSDFIIVISRTK